VEWENLKSAVVLAAGLRSGLPNLMIEPRELLRLLQCIPVGYSMTDARYIKADHFITG
jgi:hypothetical protein